VYALHPLELDVAGRGRSADPGQRALRGQDGQRLADQRHDLAGVHDAQVVVGHERDRPPALAGRPVEHDGPGLGDRHRRRRDHAVAAVQHVRGQLVIGHELDASGRHRQVQAGRDDDAAGAAPRQRGRGLIGQPVRRGAPHQRPVVGQPAGQQAEQLGRIQLAPLPVGACDRARGSGQGGCRVRRPDPGQHLGPGAHAGSRCSRRHHSRNVLAGGTGMSRALVQADKGGGRCLIRRPWPVIRPSRPARCAAP
jgi:hypothetical protein